MFLRFPPRTSFQGWVLIAIATYGLYQMGSHRHWDRPAVVICVICATAFFAACISVWICAIRENRKVQKTAVDELFPPDLGSDSHLK
jgi:hypothetical protein